MRILATTNFNNKLNQFTELTVKNKLLSIIEQIESSDNIGFLKNNSQQSVDNVYVYKIQDYRLFYTIEDKDIVFVDIIKKESQRIRISSKNPKLNSSIDPKRNSSIDPRRNSSINPKMNPSFNGLYIFDLNGNIEYFIINTNSNVILIFDNNNSFLSFGVSRANGYSIFNFNSSQSESYLASDGQNGYNQFDLNGNWIGYVK